MCRKFLDCFRDVVVVVVDIFVIVDFSVFMFVFFYECLQFSVIVFGNSFGFYFDVEVVISFFDVFVDINNGFFEMGNIDVFVEVCVSKDVEWRRNEFNFDLGFFGVGSFGSVQGGFDGVDIFVIEVGDFDIGMKFGGLGSEMFVDVKFKFVCDWSGRESDVILDFRVFVL